MRILDALTGLELLPLEVQAGLVYTVAFCPDGRRLAAACSEQSFNLLSKLDSVVKIWDATPTGE